MNLAFLNVSVFGHQAALLITVSFNKIPVFGDVSQGPDSSLFSHFDPFGSIVLDDLPDFQRSAFV